MRPINILRTEVRNLNGTSDKKCRCDSWLEHWEIFSKSTAKKCSVIGCAQDAEVGAHVIKCNSTDKEHYIVPMCQGHNKSTENSITVEKELVSANVSETCGSWQNITK